MWIELRRQFSAASDATQPTNRIPSIASSSRDNRPSTTPNNADRELGSSPAEEALVSGGQIVLPFPVEPPRFPSGRLPLVRGRDLI
jgi:hypothetical protein